MELALPALTFAVIAMIVVTIALLSGGKKGESVVKRCLEAIDKGLRRGHNSPQLKLLRDELLSDVPSLHRLLSHWSWAQRLRDYIGQAGLNIKPGRLVLLSGVVGLGGYLVLGLFNQKPILALLAAVGAALAPLAFVAIKRSRRLRAFEKNFPEAIDLLGRAVRAGHSFMTGLEMIATELAEPVAGEFRTMFDEQNFGLPLRDALLNLTERLPILDVRFFVTALLVQKETGGNLAEILDGLSAVVRDRFRIFREVRVRTAQGRLTAGILIALPIFMLCVLSIMNPTYIKVLFNDPWGPWVLSAAAAMQVTGSAVLWKIIHIEV